MRYRFWRALDTAGHKWRLPFRKWICDRFDEAVAGDKTGA